jgi:hypothetical protein
LLVSTLASLSALESDLLAQTVIGRGAGNRRTAFAFSQPTLVVRIAPHQVPASFGLGTPLDVAPCDAPPELHRSIRSSDVCFPNSRLRLPVLAGSRRCSAKLAPRAKRWALGPITYDRGRGCARTPVFSASACHVHLYFEACDRAGDVLLRRGRRGRPLTPLSPLPLRFSWDLFSRLRVGPPGQEPPRPLLPLLRDQQRLVRSETPSIDRGHFALAELALHRGAGSTVPRAGFCPTLMRGG